MHKTVEALWKMDSYPIYERNTALSIEDKIAYNQMESCKHLVDGKYQVPMLWKDVTAFQIINLLLKKGLIFF